jgi:hypothetical protein
MNASSDARKARQAAALRENLKRRKAGARAAKAQALTPPEIRPTAAKKPGLT